MDDDILKKQEFYDASKIQTAMSCPRMFFWEYVVGIRKDSAPIHTAFGHAWHVMLEHLGFAFPDKYDPETHGQLGALIDNGYNPDEAADLLVRGSEKLWPIYEKGLRTLFEEIPEEAFLTRTAQWHPKIPQRLALLLLGYINEHCVESAKFRPTGLTGVPEVKLRFPITVPATKETVIIKGRWDKLLLDDTDQPTVMEHKSGTAWHAWAGSWRTSFQIALYAAALRLMADIHKDVPVTVIVDGALVKSRLKYVQKTDANAPFRHCEFIRMNVRKTYTDDIRWINTLLGWLNRLEMDYWAARNAIMQGDPVINYVQNWRACQSFFGRECPYYVLCHSYSSPTEVLYEGLPTGYVNHVWDPDEDLSGESVTIERTKDV